MSFLEGDSVAMVLVKDEYLLAMKGLEVTGVSLADGSSIGLSANIQLLLQNV